MPNTQKPAAPAPEAQPTEKTTETTTHEKTQEKPVASPEPTEKADAGDKPVHVEK